jgi:hypothetical protein
MPTCQHLTKALILQALMQNIFFDFNAIALMQNFIFRKKETIRYL